MTTVATTDAPLRVEDVAGVRSRISWQAILAGAITAISIYLVLTLFFAAIGITLTETNMRENTIGVGVLIATLLSIIVSLFVGGAVASQLTAGETDRESILYGLLTWATVLGISVCLVGMGVRAGYFAVMGGAMIVQQSPEARNSQSWEQAARNAGVSQERIDAAKASIDPSRAAAVANDPATEERARRTLIGASWTTLVGLLLSLAACIGGAMLGRGAMIQFVPAARVQVESRRELIIP